MAETIPNDIKEDLRKVALLRQRASFDHEKMPECNKLMADLLAGLEDAGCHKTAGRGDGSPHRLQPQTGRPVRQSHRTGLAKR